MVILVFSLILEKMLQFFTIEIDVCCEFVIHDLYYVEIGSMSTFWRVSIIYSCVNIHFKF